MIEVKGLQKVVDQNLVIDIEALTVDASEIAALVGPSWPSGGGAVGIPIFLLVMVTPLALLGGLREVFRSSAWTLTHRELRALEKLQPEQLPETDAAGQE